MRRGVGELLHREHDSKDTKKGTVMRHLLMVIAVLLVVPTIALGGGPLVVTSNGVPAVWDTAHPVPYHTDRGGIGLLSNTEALTLVATSLGRWQDVPTATIAFRRVGALPVDVNNRDPRGKNTRIDRVHVVVTLGPGT